MPDRLHRLIAWRESESIERIGTYIVKEHALCVLRSFRQEVGNSLVCCACLSRRQYPTRYIAPAINWALSNIKRRIMEWFFKWTSSSAVELQPRTMQERTGSNSANICGLGSFFGKLPTELIQNIANYLDVTALCAVRGVSSELAIRVQEYLESALRTSIKQVSTTEAATRALKRLPPSCRDCLLPPLIKALKINITGSPHSDEVGVIGRNLREATNKLLALETIHIYLRDSWDCYNASKKVDQTCRTLKEVLKIPYRQPLWIHFEIDVRASISHPDNIGAYIFFLYKSQYMRLESNRPKRVDEFTLNIDTRIFATSQQGGHHHHTCDDDAKNSSGYLFFTWNMPFLRVLNINYHNHDIERNRGLQNLFRRMPTHPTLAVLRLGYGVMHGGDHAFREGSLLRFITLHANRKLEEMHFRGLVLNHGNWQRIMMHLRRASEQFNQLKCVTVEEVYEAKVELYPGYAGEVEPVADVEIWFDDENFGRAEGKADGLAGENTFLDALDRMIGQLHRRQKS